MMKSTPTEDIGRLKRIAKVAFTIGTVLAVVCHLLPPQYREICRAVANVCTLGH